MCGIAGVLDFKGRPIDVSLLKAMCNAMIHRGPDDEGIYINDIKGEGLGVGLGHRRLAIIDLSPAGHQPMSNEDGTIWIVMNGEIYNFKGMRESLGKMGHRFKSRTDTEVILHLYEEKGEACVRDLRGMFAFAIWDEKSEKLILARDRVGKKPLLFSHVNNKLIFASEFRALLSHPDINRDIDYEALHHYLTYLCIPGPLTIFDRIKKLPPASILIYQNGSIKIEKYWELDFSKKIKITEHEAVEQLIARLNEAVQIRLISDVPLGVLLSGGIDSSCITALMSRLQPYGIRTFSMGFGENQFNELPYAKLVAGHFKTSHHYDYVTPDILETLPRLVEHYGEPFGDSSALPTYYVCKKARDYVKVALNGDGGDEVFAGYRRHLANYLAEIYGSAAKVVNRCPFKIALNIFSDRPTGPNSPGNIRRFLDAAGLDMPHRYMRWIGFFDEGFKKALYTDEFLCKIKGIDSSIFLKDLFNKARDMDAIDSVLYIDTMFGLQADLLVKMDIASMSNSLEIRSPLLDHQLMEFSASLPSNLKIRTLSLKYILKKSLKGMVPDKILKRPKRGFGVPVDKWFKCQLKEYLTNTILSYRALERGYFKPDRLRGIVDSHMRGNNDYGQHLWGLLMLELWHRRFVDNI